MAAVLFPLTHAPSAPADDVRSFVEAIRRDRQPGDAIYVYHWAGLPFVYYAIQAHLPADAYTLGRCAHGSVRSYLREIDGLAGPSRVWVALPHWRDPEIDAIRGYLDEVGERRDAIEGGRFGYLYDLSRRAKGSDLDADRYPLSPALDGAPRERWSCYGVFAVPRQ